MNTAPHRHSAVFLSCTAIALGGLAAVVAAALVQLINFITNVAYYQRASLDPVSPAGHHLGLFAVAIPVVGALIIGLMARYGSPAIRGHGIPEAMEQVLRNRSRIPARITILKPLSAAISIGTGGPFGAEGPIIATGGALGSLLGQIFSVTASERKILLASGAAAGMSAIFGSPVAAVLLAVELLLFEFGARSLVPVGLACATAAAARTWFFSAEPIFAMPPVPTSSPAWLLGFALLGAITGLASVGVSRAVYWVEELFETLPVHWMWWPAIGAVGVGAIGYIAPRTLGVGYTNIEQIVSNDWPIALVAWLCALKLISWLVALGSGTSGGTLAPLLTIGSGLGALLAAGFNTAVPGWHLPLGLAALVGMTAMFAGASRALLASVVFSFETTLQPHVLPPLLAGATIAYLVAQLVTRHSIMTEKIARRGVVVPHSYSPDPLELVQVCEVMADDWDTVPESTTIEAMASGLAEHGPNLPRRQAALIVDPAGVLRGIITRGDILRAMARGGAAETVAQVAARAPVVAYPDEPVRTALTRMVQHGIGRLPVVDRQNEQLVVGYLGRGEVLKAEFLEAREPGWLARWFPPKAPVTEKAV